MPNAGDDGLPLVLLPGMNCSARLWSALGLGPVITPELTEPTLDAEVDRLLDLLPARFALVGLSLGGIVAMALARTAPERVGRLGLMSTNPHPPTATQLDSWERLRHRLAAGESARDLQRDLLPQLLSAPVRDGNPKIIETTLRWPTTSASAPWTVSCGCRPTRIDERPALTRLRCPVSIIAARDDALCGVDRHTELARLIPSARLTIIEDCGHLSPLEQPAAVAALIRDWRGEALSSAPSLVRSLSLSKGKFDPAR